MQKKLLQEAEKYAKQNHGRRIWRKIVRAMACVVVFCTTYALILPAITLEKTQCGLNEHTHSESCYEKVAPESIVSLDCTYESLGVHVHTSDCYDEENHLLCGQADFLVHEHDASCVDASGVFVCRIPEISEHAHTDSCYAIEATEPTHVHEDSCYSTERGALICQLTETDGHAHEASCFTQGQLLCQLAEQEGHTHGEGCSETVLICSLTVEPHVHNDSCYKQMTCDISEGEEHTHTEGCSGTVLICDLTEQPHTHTDVCYQTNYLCGLTETEGHAHDASCYESLLTCELTEEECHLHTDSCYELVSVLTCQLEEGTSQNTAVSAQEAEAEERTLVCEKEVIKLHSHDDTQCYETYLDEGGNEQKRLICTELIVLEHVHSESCFVTETVEAEDEDALTCTITEGHVHVDGCYDENGSLICAETENHVHSDMCYGTWVLVCGKEEHTHDLYCQNDPEADVETEADWTASFADAVLTGEWSADVITIAQTQLGYAESTRNYAVMEDGETTKGYTRYGAWYGDPYGDWCAMFASFCLHYAGVEEMPLASNCQNWIQALTEENLYQLSGDYTPKSSDLIFFDWDDDGISDHVGIVTEIIPATEEEPAKIKAIEGNTGDQVAEQEYDLGDVVILGYAKLPEKPPAYYCGLQEHIHGASCTDENGALICGIEEHTHTDECLFETTYYCGLEEHTHDESCTDENGDLVCTLEEHTHSVECSLPPELSEEDRTAVADVIRLIDALPTYDEIMARLDEFYEADDTDGEEAYLTEIYAQVEEAYRAYMALDEELRAYVTNADKLMELEFIWSRITLEEEVYNYSDLPHAAENTRVYLFDYGHMINDKITGQGMGLLPFYRIFPEYSYTVDGEAAWDHDTVGATHYGELDTSAPVINNKLVDGYPYIANGNQALNGSWLTQYGSLQYLFDPDYVAGNYWDKSYWATEIRKNTDFTDPYTADAVNPTGLAAHFRRAYLPVKNDGTGTGLFLRDEYGYWYYDSGKNAAWYNPETEQFELYNYTVIPGHEAFDIFDETTNGNFLPFNKGHVEGLTDYQTKRGKVEQNGIVLWENRVTKQVGDKVMNRAGTAEYEILRENFRLITSDRTNSVNLNFGMVVEFDFYMPSDGMLDGNGDGVKEAMEFVFKGDDDVWVFIDDVLVLDIGGCHDAQNATINFATGALSQPSGAGYHKPTTLKEAFSNAGKDTSGFKGDTFANFTAHTLKFFYMERGGNISFCRLKFNMPQLPNNAISVKKELSSSVQTLGNPDYTFALMAQDSDGRTRRLFVGNANAPDYSVFAKTKYRIMDADGTYLTNPDTGTGLFQTDEYGIFKLKAGQTAVFEEIPATDVADFYVQELINEADVEQYMSYVNQKYSSDIKVNGNAPIWQGKINWEGRTYFASEFNEANPYLGPYGTVWYGASGPITDASAGASSGFYFNQQNGVYEDRLAKLSITKQLTAYSAASAGQKYKINVELDGDPLPTGTTYTVGNATRTVGFDANGNSYVELAGGETAEIINILSGTQFHVWESEESAKGHTVEYSVTAQGTEKDAAVTASGVTGTLRVYDHVKLTVSNTQHGTELTIPVTKSFCSFAGGPYSYTFNLWEMTLTGDDLTLAASWTQADTALVSKKVEFSKKTTGFNLATLTYLKQDFDTFPVVKYYMIEETGETSPTVDNTMQYLVEVTITKSGNGIAASITNILQRSSAQGAWEDKDATSVSFVNTLTGSLTVTKTVSGGSLNVPSTGFEFTLTLASGNSGTTPGSFLSTKTDQNGAVTKVTVTATTYTFTLKHGESITFSGLPIGTEWTVKEKENGAFIESWTVGNTSGTGTTSNGTVTVGNTTAAYTNTSTYELPETGGTGTIPYTMAGLVLMLFSMAYLLYRTKARRREVS